MIQTPKTLLLFLLVLGSISLYAQRPQGNGRNGGKDMPAIGQIIGLINDSITNEHIEYATVALYRVRDNELAGGTITQKNGRFYLEKLKPGKYEV